MLRIGLILLTVLFFNSLTIGQEKIRGVCWVAGDSITNLNFEPLINNNVEWISQTPFGYMGEYNEPNIRFDGGNRRHHWGDSDYGLIYTAQMAKSCGIKTILKPHIWMNTRSGKWRSDIAMKSKKDWDLWFSNYEKMILHYAKVAEEGEMEAYCIGTELLQPSTKHPEKWRAMIRKIRKVYSGQLTYAANFYKEYDNIEFWDELDFIGVQAYFPLVSKDFPNKRELIKAWRKPMKKMAKLAKKFNKPIVFTEVGYKNTADAAIEPWVWPNNVDKDKVMISDEVQATCYEALFESLWKEDWFGGIYIWKWFHGGHRFTLDDYWAYREERRKKYMGDDYTPGMSVRFSPQGKAAEQVMARWFSK